MFPSPPLPPPAIMERGKHRGFSLIEAAVVLGVVGLVIGGIWVAAARVMLIFKVNALTTEIMQIYSNAEKNFKENGATAANYFDNSDHDFASAVLKVPSTWTPGPWRYVEPHFSFNIEFWTVGGFNQGLVLNVLPDKFDPAVCINLANGLIQAFNRFQGRGSFNVVSSSSYNFQFGSGSPSLSSIKSACRSDYWEFQIVKWF